MKSGKKILESLRVQKELEKQLAFDFARLDKKRPYQADFEHKGWRVYLEIADFDRCGVHLNEIRIERTGSALESGEPDRIDGIVERLGSGYNGLYGPFCHLETNEAADQALLRTPPAEDMGGCFYELVLTGDREATLRHFTVSATSRRRRRTAGNLSMEAFLRLVDHVFTAFAGE